MRKTILMTFALLCAVAQGAWAQTGNWTDSGNYSESWTTSTDGKTVYINSEADLARMAFCINNDTGLEDFGSGYTFLLTQNLDMSEHYWIPIGFAYLTQEGEHIIRPFKGVFDGQGHTISGINVNRPNDWYNGLFGRASNGATIKNLKITESSINGGIYTGGVVGYAGNVEIYDIICEATVSGAGNVGGIVGYNENATVKRCIYAGTSVTFNTTPYDAYNNTLGPVIGSGSGIYENNFYTSSSFDNNALGASLAYTLKVSGLSDDVKMDWVDTPGLLMDNTLYLHDGAAMRMGPYCTSADGNSMPTKRITGLSIGGMPLSMSPDCLYRHTFNASESGQTIAVSIEAFDFSGQDGSENKPYLISQTYQWDAFANAVTNAGITFEGKYFKLNDNITVGTMVGMSSRPFKGTFKGNSYQGNYYTLTFNCGTSDAPFAESYCSPFRYINGATIERLKVAGTVYTSNQYSSGLVAAVNGTNTITNCRSSIVINSSVSGTGRHGGLVACVNDGTLNISDCRFDGQMLGGSTSECGGFIGLKSNSSAVVNISNCLFSPTDASVTGYAFVNGYLNNVNINNCFYTATLGSNQGFYSYRTTYKPANIGSRTADNYSISDFAVYQNGLSVDGSVNYPTYYYVSSIGLSDNGYANEELLNELNGQTVGITLTDRTLYKDGAWNTLCLPFDLTIADSQLDGDGVDVRDLDNSSFSGGVLTINFTENGEVTQLEAGKPYLIKWTSGTNLTNPRFYNVTINQTPGKTETDYIDFIGCYDNGNIYQSGDKTNLYLGAGNTLYYPNSSSFNLNAFRGYFQLKNGLTAGEPADGVEQDASEDPVRSFVLNFGDETDGISDAVANSSSFTLHSSFQGWYTLDGRQLSGKPTQKGIYVNNGKKVAIK